MFQYIKDVLKYFDAGHLTEDELNFCLALNCEDALKFYMRGKIL